MTVMGAVVILEGTHEKEGYGRDQWSFNCIYKHLKRTCFSKNTRKHICIEHL